MEENKLYSDQALFELIATGNEDAFRLIFHEYNKKLYPFIFSIVRSESDAKEIIQEVFLKLWLQRATLPSIEKPAAWLHTITSNATYDFLRVQARYVLRLKKIPQTAGSGNFVTDQLDAKFTQAMIAEAMEQLPFKRRQVFRMARMEGMSRREIARVFNVSENTVRNQLASAMESIQDYLTQKGVLYLPVLILLLKDS